MRRFLFLVSILVLVFGCTAPILPTRPNISSICWIQSAEVRELFSQLSSIDSAVAIEIGKLPEFQDNIGEPQIQALGRFLNLMANASYGEKENLSRLLKDGLPEVRKYSAPLQAIFGMLEKKADENVLAYSLKQLLDKAWDFSDSRWEDFETVTDRLNAPRLIDYYERKRFVYTLEAEHPGDPRWLFKTNKGTCVEFTRFSLVCLRKGGYKAAAYSPQTFNEFSGFHQATLFKGKNGQLYVMDNGRPDKKGFMKLAKYYYVTY
jgi:hypothetical protein